MQIWDLLLGSLSELDLLRIGEELEIGPKPRTSMQVLQTLLRDPVRPAPALIVKHMSDDSVRLVVSRAGLPIKAGEAARAILEGHVGGGTDWITVEAPRRKPRLAWQGRHTQPAVEAVPVQVVEIVKPGLSERPDSSQLGLGALGARGVRGRGEAVNRLMWTNDNLVALQTLVDERDPHTRDWRYRGRVDLVYIDPPFMVSNNFVADNSISIEVDEAEGVVATKEPSVVELLAYKDTWREGLDSFLSMLRSRLVLLKQLLSPTGSIYVHLDWHAAHYVKVLMDELFGYENFQSEIIWKRASAHANSSASFATVVDVLVAFSMSATPYWDALHGPLDASLVRSHYSNLDANGGKRYALRDLTASMSRASESQIYEWRGMRPKSTRCWAYTKENMDRLYEEGRVQFEPGKMPRLKLYLEDSSGNPLTNLWDDIPPVNSQAAERLGYPTQKPVALLERIISASCPPGGLVLDCFMGSGTTAEAAERLGRRWIGIDNGKYAVHLARKRLISLHQQPRPPEREQYDYVECETCKNVERKPKRQKSPGRYEVRPFTVENVGVYLRGQEWLNELGEGSAWRDEMVRVFGGEPSNTHPLLHGQVPRAWVHVGPLDMPVSQKTAWAVARAAMDSSLHAVELLSADLDPLPQPERDAILRATGVRVVVRVIPQAAIDQVRLRLQRGPGKDGARESMAIPAFYTPLSIGLRAQVKGALVSLTLERCEVDIQSFINSQRPALPAIREGMSEIQRKKAQGEHERWLSREQTLREWLEQASTWQHFVDFWAVDWDYADQTGPDGQPVFNTEWQSFATRAAKQKRIPPVFTAEARYDRAGHYQIAARVTDVFGNDGLAVVDVQVGT